MSYANFEIGGSTKDFYAFVRTAKTEELVVARTTCRSLLETARLKSAQMYDLAKTKLTALEQAISNDLS